MGEKEKMEKCGGHVTGKVGSGWAGKSPECQVRTLDLDLVKWGPTGI